LLSRHNIFLAFTPSVKMTHTILGKPVGDIGYGMMGRPATLMGESN
jgi:hypothetical protein